MVPRARRKRERRNRRQAVRLSKSNLDALVERATTDCYNEAEQVAGLFTMIEDNLELPFETTVLGVSVTATTQVRELAASCRRSSVGHVGGRTTAPLPRQRLEQLARRLRRRSGPGKVMPPQSVVNSSEVMVGYFIIPRETERAEDEGRHHA